MSSSVPADALRVLAVALAAFLAPLIAGTSSRPLRRREGERPPAGGRIKYLCARRQGATPAREPKGVAAP